MVQQQGQLEWGASREVLMEGRGEGEEEEGRTRKKKSLGNYTLTDYSPTPLALFTLSSHIFHTPFGPIVILV